jgi:hypothetical protein
MALLRFLFAISELLTNVWKDAPSEARVAANLKLSKELDFWFGCDCCAVGVLVPTGPDDPPDLTRGKEVRLVWEVDALFAWTLDEFEDYLASERYSLPTTSRLAAVEDVTSPSSTSLPTASAAGRTCSAARVAGSLVPWISATSISAERRSPQRGSAALLARCLGLVLLLPRGGLGALATQAMLVGGHEWSVGRGSRVRC